jgi:superfamily II DNA/RNA helicase
MSNLIEDIKNGKNLDRIFQTVINNLYRTGPISITDMEILSYLKLYSPHEFDKNKEAILNFMGVFYKNVRPKSLKEIVFRQYRRHILDTYNQKYTPVQANIVKEINANKCFSFSAPTSTGKSYVFMNFIRNSIDDVVVVVPSRALINEYFIKLSNLIEDSSVNVLTFIDKINTKNSSRNVFVVTPERCRELFKDKNLYNVGTFLFDEAQLSNEDSKRGLYFDSIVRRCQKAFPNSSFVFAHPFVKNPESQIIKNNFSAETSYSIQYTQKNVGQMFLCPDKEWNFYHFGIDKSIMGSIKKLCSFDPIAQTINTGGSVLFYVSKSKILDRRFLTEFARYIDLCKDIISEKIESYISQLKEYTGGDTLENENYYSQMIALLKKGIVIHHGSLPLQSRIIIENFTQAGLCRICFATSTLEQGINMPFDVVYLDTLQSSKPLSVKNLIGRAGRSTLKVQYDFGYVIINSPNSMSRFRKIMLQDEILDQVSALEKDENKDDDYNDFKDAIRNNTFSDEYNLSEKDLNKLAPERIEAIVVAILNLLFTDNKILSWGEINQNPSNRILLYDNFQKLYAIYLGRELVDGEKHVLDTAIKIILWKVQGKTFKNICWYRYSHASRTIERETFVKNGKNTSAILAEFITGYHDIPDKNHKVYSLFPLGTKATDVDYDLIMYDTYDFIDKLIGFKLSDIFYAAFIRFYKQYNDQRAEKLSKYIKYGTDNENHIWMLRYGMSFEDIDLLEKHIESINSEEIIFKASINDVSKEIRYPIERFIMNK